MAIGVLEEVKSTLKEKEVHWKIPDFWSLNTLYTQSSPTFNFLDVRWQLKICPKDQIALYLNMTDRNTMSYNVVTTFASKKADGSLAEISSFKHEFCEQKLGLVARHFITRSALSQCKSEMTPSNELTIVCNLKKLPDPVKLMELNTLSENMKHLYTNEELWDTVLRVNEKEFKAHRIILAARSSVFAAMFKHETSEKQTGIVNIIDCDSDSFQEFLEFLYSGQLENVSFRSALQLYKTADKYNVQELKRFCVEYMEHNLKVENICDVFVLAEEYDESELHAAAQDFFNRNIVEIFETLEWKTLLKSNTNFANKILMEMASNVKIVEKDAKWGIL